MKKRITKKQFVILLAGSLMISLFVNYADVIQGLQDGWNAEVTVR